MQHVDRPRSRTLARVFAAVPLAALLAGSTLTACGDDSQSGDGGNGGGASSAAATTVATTVAATTVSVTASTGGGEGGGDGTGGGSGSGGATFACGDDSVCEGTLCSFDPQGETWSCIAEDDCQDERRCEGECCPTGSRCSSGECLPPDLSADGDRLEQSLELLTRTYRPNSCEIAEGCIDGPGTRRLLRFDLKTPNSGAGDLFLGDPDDNEDLFEYSSCHEHFHFTTYAAYRLLDDDGNVAASGHKQAFCLLDFEREDGDPTGVYDCGYQGIQAGWSDIYDSYLPCQWVDVTDVAPGAYRLEIALNTDHVLIESDYENNLLVVPVTIADESCANGCSEWSDEVCQPGDPMARAGDGFCDCNGIFEWDVADCSSCSACMTVSCVGGCSPENEECCGDEDTCGLARDGVCDCDGDAEWDEVDCARCRSADEDCGEQNTCPRGCGFTGDECDGEVDLPSLGDGYCDCGEEGWDTIDCFACRFDCGQD